MGWMQRTCSRRTPSGQNGAMPLERAPTAHAAAHVALSAVSPDGRNLVGALLRCRRYRATVAPTVSKTQQRLAELVEALGAERELMAQHRQARRSSSPVDGGLSGTARASLGPAWYRRRAAAWRGGRQTEPRRVDRRAH